MEIEKCRNFLCSEKDPWRCFCRISEVDGKARHNMQCWSNAKECFAGNVKNTEKGVGNVKTGVFCNPLVICYDSPNRKNDGNNKSQNANVKNK